MSTEWFIGSDVLGSMPGKQERNMRMAPRRTPHPEPFSRKLGPRLLQVRAPEVMLSRWQEELTRQRTLLLADWDLSFPHLEEHAHFADPADQASNDLERNLSYEVKRRVITKLKRIERALCRLRTKNYGYCRRCRKAIPNERLAVQPDALYCVPCLALIERRVSKN
ncbi:MAG: TraR/DksA family transcriptional regulator [Nitrospira sp.]